MNNFFYEFKKNFFNPAIIFIIIIFLFLNALMCQTIIERQTIEYTKEFVDAHKKIYQNVSGKISKENIDFVISEKNRLNSIILSGEYDTNFDLSNTYTGYIFSDNNLINTLYDDIYYSYNYSNYSNQIKEAAQINSDKYLKKDNVILSKEYKFMATCFDNRNISSFYTTKGWDKYLSYSFSNLLVVLIIIVGCAPIFSKEKECGMSILLKTTICGKKKITFYKIMVVVLFSFLITIIFSTQDFIIFKYNYSLTGFLNPIYSISEFKNTGLNITIVEYLILNFFAKWLGILNISILVIIISSFNKSDTISLLCNLFVFFIHILIYLNFNSYSFLSLMNIYTFTNSFNVLNIAGIITHTIYWLILLNFFVLEFLAAFCFWINLKPKKHNLKDDIYETSHKMGTI